MSKCDSVVAPRKVTSFLGALATLTLCAGAAHAADWSTTSDAPTRPVAFGQRAEITPLEAAQARAHKLIELQTFLALPLSAKRLIMDAGAAPELYEHNEFDTRVIAENGETPYEDLASIISRDTYDIMRPMHRHMLKRLMETTREHGPIVSLCFTPGTPTAVVQAFEDAVFGNLLDGDRFQLTNRWTISALGEPSYAQGDPLRLTYSFVPDGTFVPDIIGVTGNSQLFAFLNGIYGTPATWQAIYASVWDRWSSISGLEYVLEPNDDGVTLNNNNGITGVRGDLRMAAIPIDGNSGTLAYNNFPNDGDMVLDAFDSYYNNTSDNSLRLFNILAHEHGHGQGLLHVCPREETKLMEPFISTMFNGPQFDDQLASQRHYGDNSEPNDDSGEAASIGAFSGSPITSNLLSIDDNSDVDYFSVTIAAPTAFIATVTPAQRAPYLQGSQNSACNGGSLFDPKIIQDLKVDILGADGVTVLDSADANGIGEAETALGVINAPGTYFIRVRGSGANNIQRYALRVENAPSIIRLASAVDEFVPAGSSVEVIADAFSSNADPIIGGSVTLNYRFDGGAYLTTVMSATGPNAYAANLPSVACADMPEFYISAETNSGTLLDPPSGAAAPYSFGVGVLAVTVDDDFETDMGWTVTGNATTGQWDRGVPVNDDQGDPVSDFDGSGQCWLTQNQAGNTDVDNGSTILTSTVFDASEGGTLSYAYWINSGPGALDSDSLSVQVATDAGGTNWTTVRNYTTGSDNWRTDSLTIASAGGDIDATSTLRIRFTATDGGTPSYIEAGIDSLLIESLSCTDVAGCEGDTNGDNIVNFTDLNAVLAAFGQTGMGIAGDVNDDGVVNFTDLNTVLANFGLSCK